jgi:hypothetical protein
LIGEVGPRLRETFYTRHGGILPKISVAVLIISFLSSIVVLMKWSAMTKRAGKR